MIKDRAKLNMISLSLLAFSLALGNQIANIILLLMLLFSPLLYRGRNLLAALKDPLIFAPVLFYIFHLLSLTWSGEHGHGSMQLETKLGILLIPLFVKAGSVELGSKEARTILKAFIYGCLVALIISFGFATYRYFDWSSELAKVTYKPSLYFVYKRFSMPIMHPAYYSAHLAVAILILIFQSPFRNKRGTLVAGVLCAVSLILLQGRMQILALVGVGMIFIASKAVSIPKLRWAMLSIVVLLGLAFTVMPKQYLGRFAKLTEWEYDISGGPKQFNSATYRLAEWKAASICIQRSPWIGSGVGDNREALFRVYEELKFYEGLDKRFNAHNQYLETTIATGFIGLLFLLFWLLMYGRNAWMRKDSLLIATWLFLIMCLLAESFLERAWGVLIFSALMPILWFLPELKDAEKAN